MTKKDSSDLKSIENIVLSKQLTYKGKPLPLSGLKVYEEDGWIVVRADRIQGRGF